MTCDDLTREAIERLACGEVSGVDRAALEQHVDGCDGCRVLLDDLRTIRAGMHARGVVGTPPGGDWTPFMARLEQRLDLADHRERRARRTRMRALALAATLVLGIALGTWWTRARPLPAPAPILVSASSAAVVPQDIAVSAVTIQHLERTKLVLLGLLAKEASDPRVDWSYERTLAGDLLPDTSLYRLAAQRQRLPGIAHVLRDVELVMLQASLSDDADPATLGRLQRVIRGRDLLAKVDSLSEQADRAVPRQSATGI